MVLLAPTLVDIAPQDLPEAVRLRFGTALRRLGVFTHLCQLGAETCLEAAGPGGRLGVLLSTARGAASAARAALDDGLRRGEPVMPFTFIATQTNLAGALLARRSHDVARAACLYPAAEDWPWLLRMGQSWLADCERVLLGWVEESAAEGEPHRSHWCLLAREASSGAVSCSPGTGGAEATAGDWISRVARWLEKPERGLELRGGAEAWRFSSHRGA